MEIVKTYGIKTCANEICGKEFESHRVNMKYCSNECCRKATNAKLIARYHSNKEKKIVQRICKCGTKLSRYNDDTICHACRLKEEHDGRKALLARLGIKYTDDEFD